MRKRLTWTMKKAEKFPGHPPYGMIEDKGEWSDPYNMNAPHKNPHVNKYQTGDTSSWCEDPDMDTKWKQDKRNEVNLPKHDPRYDGQGDKPWGDEYAKKAAMKAAKALKMKALKCTKLAYLTLPEGTSEEVIEEQGFGFMALSEEQIDNTIQRIEAEIKEETVEAEVKEATLQEKFEAAKTKLAEASDEETKLAAEKEAAELVAELQKSLNIEAAEEEKEEKEEVEEKEAAEEEKEEVEEKEEKEEKEATVEENEETVVARLLLAKVDKLIKQATENPESEELKKQASKIAKWARLLVAEDECEEECKEEEKESTVVEADQNDRANKNWPPKGDAEKIKDEAEKGDPKDVEAADEEEKEEKEEKVEADVNETSETTEAAADEEKEEKEEVEEKEAATEETTTTEVEFSGLDNMFLAEETEVVSEKEASDLEDLFLSPELKAAKKAEAEAEEAKIARKEGVSSLAGGIKIKEASTQEVVDDLSTIWDSAPDVSQIFG